MADSIAIKVESVSKTFRLPHEKVSSIKGAVLNFYKRKRTFERQEVLENISFEIKKGEFFGIVGRNGSGKSTLLKLLAGIYSPDEGTIRVEGKLTPFIELGVGFNPELTGRENVFLNGALLGFSRKEMAGLYDEIVAFAELEKFMDQKLKNYSSGMQVRLAFSVATRAKTDILLIDEVLAVGDQSFQEKCFEYFAQIKQSGKTVVFVTHDMSNVERFCDRVFVIDKQKEANGLYTIPEAVSLYNRLNHEKPETRHSPGSRSSTGDIYVQKVELLDSNNKLVDTFKSGAPFAVKVYLGKKRQAAKHTPLLLGLAFYDKEGVNLSGPNSSKQPFTSDAETVTYRLDALPFTMGEYYLTVALFNDKATKQYDYLDRQIGFFVNATEVYHGKIILDGRWTHEEN